jgi:hypothetical protein
VALSRKFLDSEGVNWQVYELSTEDGTRDPGVDSWLYFFSRSATRALAAHLDDWARFDWPGLERLCRNARPPMRREPVRRPAATPAVDV